jgi:hypothetical protein
MSSAFADGADMYNANTARRPAVGISLNQLKNKNTKKQPCIGRRAKRAPANDLRASLRTQRLVWLAQSSQFLFADTGQNGRSEDDASLRNAPAVNGASARRQVRVPRVP